MTRSQLPRTPAHRARWMLLAALLALGASGAALGFAHGASPSPDVATPVPSSVPTGGGPSTARVPSAAPGSYGPGELAAPAGTLPVGRGVALGSADGLLPGGTTALDSRLPGIARLDRALLDALRHATVDAQRDGVQLDVDSGWRSARYQELLLRQAVTKYGSEAEAARWVATPTTSAHVAGAAVDVGPADAATWLSAHGAGYGLCQVYANEPWHFELRPAAMTHGCPPMYGDPTQDPRMQH